ncbi:hypothetical protein BH20ACT24_BH20ACT24_15910 [soil metagenome]
MELWIGTKNGLRRGDADPLVEIEGVEVTAIAIEGATRWAIVRGRDLRRSADGGAWETVATLHDLRANCLLPTSSGVLVGTSEARLMRHAGGALEVVEGFGRVAHRDDWYTPWGGPPDVRTLAANPSTLFANVHVGGIPRSRDGGDTWEPTVDIDADVHQVLTHDGWVLAAAARGLLTSEDDGESWLLAAAEGLHGSYCRAVAVAGDTVLLSASTGPFSKQAAVYRRALGADGGFERCRNGLPEWFGENIDTACVAATEKAAAVGTSDGSVFLSEDRGDTWRAVATGLPSVTCLALS